MQKAVIPQPADLENILDSLDAVVYVSDIDTYELLYMNQYALKHIGKVDDFAQIQGKRCYQVLQKQQTSPCEFCTNSRLPENGDTYLWEFQNTRNGCWYQCRDRLIDWHDGRRVRLEIAADISLRKQTEQQLEAARDELKELAERDSLTQLYNRRAFFLNADALRKSLPHDQQMGLMIIDLDYFKAVNDTYGHEAGDTLLAAIGQKLKHFSNNHTVIGRMGGEEFAIAFAISGQLKPEPFALAIYTAIADIRALYFNDTLRCTASIGLSCQTVTAPLKAALRAADNALYKAKAAGRSQIKMA